MPRHKKTSKRSHHRRRVSGTNLGSAAKKIAGIAAGAVVARLVSTKFLSTTNPKIVAVVEIAAGVFLPKFVKGDLGNGIADGLIAVGTLNLLQQLGVVGAAPRIPIATKFPNGYNANTMRSVGGESRPFLNRAVGNTNHTNKATADMMGALLWGD